MAELNSSPQNAGSASRSKKLSTRVDLTAMVDLAFLLITFFMITTTLTKSKAMDVAMPDDGIENVPIPETRSFTICIGKDDKVMYYLGQIKAPLIAPVVTNFGKDGLRKAIMETSKMVHDKTGKNMLVVIKPSEHSVYNSLVSTLDELNITQTPSYAIVDITPEDVTALKEKGAY